MRRERAILRLETARSRPIFGCVGRRIRFFGLLVLAAAAWFPVAEEAGWIASDMGDRWFLPLAGLGGAVFVVGLLLGALDPARRWMSRGRCARCGAATERGQVYCLDHLRATVHEARDHTRETYHRGR